LNVIIENLPVVFSREIERLIKCQHRIKEEIEKFDIKLISLVEKLENSIQQYGTGKLIN